MAQFDLLVSEVGECAAVLACLCEALGGSGLVPGFSHLPGSAGAPAGTFLVGVSARLLKGSWTPWRDDSDYSRRWGRRVRCPPSLRTMTAKRDVEFAAFRTEAQRVAHETDVCVVVEAADSRLLDEALAGVARLAPAVTPAQVHRGRLPADRRDPFGFEDGISNLQHVREHDPERYRDLVFSRGPGGEVTGTNLVFRRYRVRPERLARDAPLVIPDPRGGPSRSLTPEQIVGRCRTSGQVVHGETGERLPAEPDERQGAHAFLQSHLRKANPRGRGLTNFGHHVNVPDARILRRSYPYAVPADEGGAAVEHGLLFLAFQSDVRHGFELINNEWLMSDFNGAPDPLLAPESGLVEPLTGCYYYVPRDQRQVGAAVRELLS